MFKVDWGKCITSILLNSCWEVLNMISADLAVVCYIFTVLLSKSYEVLNIKCASGYVQAGRTLHAPTLYLTPARVYAVHHITFVCSQRKLVQLLLFWTITTEKRWDIKFFLRNYISTLECNARTSYLVFMTMLSIYLSKITNIQELQNFPWVSLSNFFFPGEKPPASSRRTAHPRLGSPQDELHSTLSWFPSQTFLNRMDQSWARLYWKDQVYKHRKKKSIIIYEFKSFH